MSGRPILAAAGWLVTALAALLAGLGAIRLVGESITGTPGGVRSQREVARALAEPAPATPAPAPTASAGAVTGSPVGGTTSPAAVGTAASSRRAFATGGGSAVAECVPGGVRLVSWAPAPGWRAAEVERGPDDHVEVRFLGPGGEAELKLRCAGSPPTPQRRD
ncbi:septum formation initiator [Micromonospora sp. NPDC000089]|uniref:septum formation initiator n=1 Tax=unclassified Micromonospora TaxID=2617518 RepID=UPI0036CB450E